MGGCITDVLVCHLLCPYGVVTCLGGIRGQILTRFRSGPTLRRGAASRGGKGRRGNQNHLSLGARIAERCDLLLATNA